MEASYKLLNAGVAENHQILRPNVAKTRRISLTFAFIFAIALISLFYAHYDPVAHFAAEPHKHLFSDSDSVIQQCPSGLPSPASPPAPVNLWASLDLEEAVQIRQWLHAPEQRLNLTRAESDYTSNSNDNVIYNVESYYPSKSEALAYLGSPSIIPAPDRYARVTIHHGARLEPVIKDYLVGPLPVGAQTEMRELTSIYHRKDIPFNARGFTMDNEILRFLGRIVVPLSDITKVSSRLIIYFDNKLKEDPWPGTFRRSGCWSSK